MSNQDGMRPTGLYEQPKQYVAHEIIWVMGRMWSQQGCLSPNQEFIWVLQLIRDTETAINGFAESQDFGTANMSIRARISLRCKRNMSGTNFKQRCIWFWEHTTRLARRRTKRRITSDSVALAYGKLSSYKKKKTYRAQQRGSQMLCCISGPVCKQSC